MEKPSSFNQKSVYLSIPDTVFVQMNELAESISQKKFQEKKLAKRKEFQKKYHKYEAIARGMITAKQIVYKGNQRFNMEIVEFADSSMLSKKSNKGVKIQNHSAKRRVLN